MVRMSGSPARALGTQAPDCGGGSAWAPLDEVGDLAEQGGLRLGPDHLLDDLATGEDVQGRDEHDPVLLRRLRVLFDVELDHVDLVGVLLGDLLKHRGDLAARSTPLRPVVHDDRLLVLQYIDLEAVIGHDLGCAHGGCFLSSLRVVRFRDSWSVSQRSASRAAAQPVPAAVTAWRYV